MWAGHAEREGRSAWIAGDGVRNYPKVGEGGDAGHGEGAWLLMNSLPQPDRTAPSQTGATAVASTAIASSATLVLLVPAPALVLTKPAC
jgi:hypothetical protein